MAPAPYAVDLAPRSNNDPNNLDPFTHGLVGVDQVSNSFYTDVLVIMLAVLILGSFLLRLYQMWRAHYRHIVASGPGRDYQNLWARNSSQIGPWLKRHILYAPFWGKRHNKEWRINSAVGFGTLPSRFHSVLLIVYVASNIAYCFILPWTTQGRAKTLAELRGRSGYLATFNLIPMTLCAIRNNPLISILQVSYDTFNLFHRWIARIFVFEAIVHTLAWWINMVEVSGWHSISKHFATSTFIQWGAVSTFVGIAIFFLSWSPIRHGFYEAFLNIHKLLAIFVYAGIWVHLQVGKIDAIYMMEIVIVFLVFEYVARLARIAWYNLSRKRNTKVTIEALPGEACRVTFDLARPWKFRPGHHVHVYLPRFSWHSSHPFSVAWAEDHVIGNFNEKLPTDAIDLDREDEIRTSISLVCRARTGLTRKIYDSAASSANGIVTTWGLLEGPYGGHGSLDSYGTILLFAGGVGITHQIGYLRHLIKGYDDHTVAAKKIILIWSVPNSESLEMVRPWMDEILKLKGRREVLRIQLFVTKPKTQQEIVSGTRSVTMFPGRCNVQTVIDKEFSERTGAMAITTCGPGEFSDAVRHAARKRCQLGVLDFVEEAFTY